jgi:hypothetical protein
MPVIDLSFVLDGMTIPLEHGYSLFSAICRVVPGLPEPGPGPALRRRRLGRPDGEAAGDRARPAARWPASQKNELHPRSGSTEAGAA